MATSEKRGNSWRFWVHRKDPVTGEVIRKSRTFKTKADGEAWARDLERTITRGEFNPGTITVDSLLDDFISRYVQKSDLRTADEIEALLSQYVRPKIGSRSIYTLRRSEIVNMLDAIEDEVSPRQADKVLSQLRRAFNWYAPRDDHFNSPIVPGMTRVNLRQMSRDRVLDDEELRQLWSALPKINPTYARIIRALLFSAQRLNDIAELSWPEINEDVFTIPAARYKTKLPHTVPLTDSLKKLIGKAPDKVTEDNLYVFSTTAGKKPFSGFSKAKKALDRAIGKIRSEKGLDPIPAWRIHDLRRTARSLMARAGVPSDYAERVVGHVQGGVEGIYDKHTYLNEKREALKKLQGLIEVILSKRETTSRIWHAADKETAAEQG